MKRAQKKPTTREKKNVFPQRVRVSKRKEKHDEQAIEGQKKCNKRQRKRNEVGLVQTSEMEKNPTIADHKKTQHTIFSSDIIMKDDRNNNRKKH